MFSRVFIAALVALPIIVSATPAPSYPSGSHPSGGQCNIGEVHCCKHTQQFPGNSVATANSLLGLPIDIVPMLGFGCTPITVLGVGGTSCSAQTVCCEGNKFTSLLNLFPCSPVNINL
ncbi:Hydrophobin-1 [Leucoagaricus sp. SymC.cos]|nr:Hydrophobin-1 [Leucoagaricus sp. SymC.cos]